MALKGRKMSWDNRSESRKRSTVKIKRWILRKKKMTYVPKRRIYNHRGG